MDNHGQHGDARVDFHCPQCKTSFPAFIGRIEHDPLNALAQSDQYEAEYWAINSRGSFKDGTRSRDYTTPYDGTFTVQAKRSDSRAFLYKFEICIQGAMGGPWVVEFTLDPAHATASIPIRRNENISLRFVSSNEALDDNDRISTSLGRGEGKIYDLYNYELVPAAPATFIAPANAVQVQFGNAGVPVTMATESGTDAVSFDSAAFHWYEIFFGEITVTQPTILIYRIENRG